MTMKPIRRKAVLFSLLVMALFGMATASPGFIGNVTADSQPISFTVSDSSHGLIASFAVNAEYSGEVHVASGSQATISYALSSATGSIRITIPLAQLGTYIGYPLSDQSITVPIPVTPIGSVRIPISSYISEAMGVPIPASVASIDLLIQSSIKAFPSAMSGASANPLTTMEWIDWGSQSVLLDTGSMPNIDKVTTSFGYVLSYSVVASVLNSDFDLIPMTALSSVASSQTASTNVVIEQGISMLVIVAIVIVAVVVALLALVLWRKGKKKAQP